MATTDVDNVDLTREIGLWACFSSSSSVYYVSTEAGTLAEGDTGAKMMRAQGTGPTGIGPSDDQWKPLLSVRSIPVRDTPDGWQEIDSTRDELDSILRVGCRHLMYYDLDARYDGWWFGRKVERIALLKRMPPPGKRTKPEAGGQRR